MFFFVIFVITKMFNQKKPKKMETAHKNLPLVLNINVSMTLFECESKRELYIRPVLYISVRDRERVILSRQLAGYNSPNASYEEVKNFVEDFLQSFHAVSDVASFVRSGRLSFQDREFFDYSLLANDDDPEYCYAVLWEYENERILLFR